MPETEHQDRTLAELVVKEAVGAGLESSMREPIVEAVEEAEGSGGGARGVSMLGAGLAVGGAVGYLLGLHDERSAMLERLPVGEQMAEDIGEQTAEERSVVTELTEQVVGTEAETASEQVTDTETDEGEETGPSVLPRLALLAGLVAAVALLRRRLRSDEGEEWEPIEDFESTVETAGEAEAPGEPDAADEEVGTAGEEVTSTEGDTEEPTSAGQDEE